jgi:hypothetical protein
MDLDRRQGSARDRSSDFWTDLILLANSRRRPPSWNLDRIRPPAKDAPQVSNASAEFAISINIPVMSRKVAESLDRVARAIDSKRGGDFALRSGGTKSSSIRGRFPSRVAALAGFVSPSSTFCEIEVATSRQVSRSLGLGLERRQCAQGRRRRQRSGEVGEREPEDLVVDDPAPRSWRPSAQLSRSAHHCAP